MSYTTNVPACTFGPNGFAAPSEQAILAGRQADLNAAFGGNLNMALETPQGQIASSDTAIIGDGDTQFVALANGVDPYTATGRYQDAIGNIYFMIRKPAQPTVVSVTVGGGNGLIIPANIAVATDSSGSTYAASSALTISASGTQTGTFYNLTAGPIPCASNSLTIYLTIPGWDTVSNSTGVLGTLVENQQEFELRRELSVQVNANSVNSSVQGAILALPGVLDCYVTDNSTSGSVTSGGVTLGANSIYICTYGGTDTQIGTAIITKKPPGPSYNGTHTVSVQDPNPLYNGAGPSYSPSWTVASPVTINGALSIPSSTGVPSNAGSLVQSAFSAAFAGTDGLPRVSQIGNTVFASRFYSGIQALGAWAANIDSLYVGTSTTPSLTLQSTNINQIPTAGTISLTLI